MLDAALNVHITWEAFIGSNITELCGSPGEVEQPEVVKLLLLLSLIFPPAGDSGLNQLFGDNAYYLSQLQGENLVFVSLWH